MSQIRLKSCPFCGGKAELKNKRECYGHGENIEEHFVSCIICGASGARISEYRFSPKVAISKAIKFWNTRHQETDNEEDDGR